MAPAPKQFLHVPPVGTIQLNIVNQSRQRDKLRLKTPALLIIAGVAAVAIEIFFSPDSKYFYV